MWISRKEADRVAKLYRVLASVCPKMLRDIERYVRGNYPADNIAKIIKKKYFEDGDTE